MQSAAVIYEPTIRAAAEADDRAVPGPSAGLLTVDEGGLSLHCPDKAGGAHRVHVCQGLDKVFGHGSTAADVYGASVLPLVAQAVDGGAATVVVLGHEAARHHLLEGGPENQYHGLIALAAQGMVAEAYRRLAPPLPSLASLAQPVDQPVPTYRVLLSWAQVDPLRADVMADRLAVFRQQPPVPLAADPQLRLVERGGRVVVEGLRRVELGGEGGSGGSQQQEDALGQVRSLLRAFYALHDRHKLSYLHSLLTLSVEVRLSSFADEFCCGEQATHRRRTAAAGDTAAPVAVGHLQFISLADLPSGGEVSLSGSVRALSMCGRREGQPNWLTTLQATLAMLDGPSPPPFHASRLTMLLREALLARQPALVLAVLDPTDSQVPRLRSMLRLAESLRGVPAQRAEPIPADEEVSTQEEEWAVQQEADHVKLGGQQGQPRQRAQKWEDRRLPPGRGEAVHVDHGIKAEEARVAETLRSSVAQGEGHVASYSAAVPAVTAVGLVPAAAAAPPPQLLLQPSCASTEPPARHARASSVCRAGRMPDSPSSSTSSCASPASSSSLCSFSSSSSSSRRPARAPPARPSSSSHHEAGRSQSVPGRGRRGPEQPLRPSRVDGSGLLFLRDQHKPGDYHGYHHRLLQQAAALPAWARRGEAAVDGGSKGVEGQLSQTDEDHDHRQQHLVNQQEDEVAALAWGLAREATADGVEWQTSVTDEQQRPHHQLARHDRQRQPHHQQQHAQRHDLAAHRQQLHDLAPSAHVHPGEARVGTAGKGGEGADSGRRWQHASLLAGVGLQPGEAAFDTDGKGRERAEWRRQQLEHAQHSYLAQQQLQLGTAPPARVQSGEASAGKGVERAGCGRQQQHASLLAGQPGETGVGTHSNEVERVERQQRQHASLLAGVQPGGAIVDTDGKERERAEWRRQQLDTALAPAQSGEAAAGNEGKVGATADLARQQQQQEVEHAMLLARQSDEATVDTHSSNVKQQQQQQQQQQHEAGLLVGVQPSEAAFYTDGKGRERAEWRRQQLEHAEHSYLAQQKLLNITPMARVPSGEAPVSEDGKLVERADVGRQQQQLEHGNLLARQSGKATVDTHSSKVKQQRQQQQQHEAGLLDGVQPSEAAFDTDGKGRERAEWRRQQLEHAEHSYLAQQKLLDFTPPARAQPGEAAVGKDGKGVERTDVERQQQQQEHASLLARQSGKATVETHGNEVEWRQQQQQEQQEANPSARVPPGEVIADTDGKGRERAEWRRQQLEHAQHSYLAQQQLGTAPPTRVHLGKAMVDIRSNEVEQQHHHHQQAGLSSARAQPGEATVGTEGKDRELADWQQQHHHQLHAQHYDLGQQQLLQHGTTRTAQVKLGAATVGTDGKGREAAEWRRWQQQQQQQQEAGLWGGVPPGEVMVRTDGKGREKAEWRRLQLEHAQHSYLAQQQLQLGTAAPVRAQPGVVAQVGTEGKGGSRADVERQRQQQQLGHASLLARPSGKATVDMHTNGGERVKLQRQRQQQEARLLSEVQPGEAAFDTDGKGRERAEWRRQQLEHAEHWYLAQQQLLNLTPPARAQPSEAPVVLEGERVATADSGRRHHQQQHANLLAREPGEPTADIHGNGAERQRSQTHEDASEPEHQQELQGTEQALQELMAMLAALSAENERLRRQGLEDGEGGRTEHKADEKGEGTRQPANTKTQLLKTARQELRDYEVYKEVVEAAVSRMQSEMQALKAERDEAKRAVQKRDAALRKARVTKHSRSKEVEHLRHQMEQAQRLLANAESRAREAERRMSMAVEEKAQAVKEIVAAKAKHREEAAKAVESHLADMRRLQREVMALRSSEKARLAVGGGATMDATGERESEIDVGPAWRRELHGREGRRGSRVSFAPEPDLVGRAAARPSAAERAAEDEAMKRSLRSRAHAMALKELQRLGLRSLSSSKLLDSSVVRSDDELLEDERQRLEVARRLQHTLEYGLLRGMHPLDTFR